METVHAQIDERLVSLPDGAALLLRDSGGPGLPVLLCHPHTGNAWSWAAQEAALIKAGYRTLAYARRFHAGSQPGATRGTYGGDAVALLDALDIDSCACVGVAAGGAVVLELLLGGPDRIRAGVIAGSVMGLADGDLADRIAALRPDGFSNLPAAVQELGPDFRFANPGAVLEWEALRARNPLNGRQGFATRPTPQGLAGLSGPLLLMTGSADLFLPPAALTEVARAIPCSTVQIMPGAGHAPHVETPDAFNAAILSFLRAVS